MNFLRKFLGSTPKDDLSIIPSGQLFLKRAPGSPKSASECLYTDAVASIRETSAPHNYVLVIQRAFAEGEELLRDDDDEDEDEADEFKDERMSLIDKAIKVQKRYRDGDTIVSWKNTEGDDGETFEFVVDASVKESDVDQFMQTIYACCFERKYQRSSAGVTSKQLEEFVVDPEIENPEDLTDSVNSLIRKIEEDQEEEDQEEEVFEDASDDVKVPLQEDTTSLVEGDEICKVEAEFRLYDPSADVFVLQTPTAEVMIVDLSHWDYWLSITGGDLKLGTSITSELDPYFDDSIQSFIFAYSSEKGTLSVLLKFVAGEAYTLFKEAFTRSNWENSNRSKWAKVEETNRKYVLNAYNAVRMEEGSSDLFVKDSDESESETEGEEEEEDEEQSKYTNLRTGLRKEAFSDSEDDDNETEGKKSFNKTSKNNNLTISYKNDRSYVTRGNRIGVFKTTEDDDLEFATAIENLTINGKPLKPSKMMLHVEDSSLVIQGDDKNKLYRMDLQKGKIVDEWKANDYLNVVDFGPGAKFSQMTGEQTFLGISDKGLFKLDPRLSGDKLVEDQYKLTFTKNEFSSFGTTESGYIAVGSNKGDIRLYDKVGIRAKSLIPAIGDPIKHLEVSADGKWLLATCKTYLMLIDLTIKEGVNAGKLGFQKSFGKDQTPKTRMLKISPEHVAFIKASTQKSLDFSQAHFNTGLDTKEQTIVSSSGPYAITWSLKKILRGDAEPYLIKRYSSNIVADNFKFGTDKNVIIALQDDVGMVNKKEFRKANRVSLALNPRRT